MSELTNKAIAKITLKIDLTIFQMNFIRNDFK